MSTRAAGCVDFAACNLHFICYEQHNRRTKSALCIVTWDRELSGTAPVTGPGILDMGWVMVINTVLKPIPAIYQGTSQGTRGVCTARVSCQFYGNTYCIFHHIKHYKSCWSHVLYPCTIPCTVSLCHLWLTILWRCMLHHRTHYETCSTINKQMNLWICWAGLIGCGF